MLRKQLLNSWRARQNQASILSETFIDSPTSFLTPVAHAWHTLLKYLISVVGENGWPSSTLQSKEGPLPYSVSLRMLRYCAMCFFLSYRAVFFFLPDATTLHAVVTSTIKIFSLLLHDCNFATVHNVNICVFRRRSSGTPVKRSLGSWRVATHRLRTTSIGPASFIKKQVFWARGSFLKLLVGPRTNKLFVAWRNEWLSESQPGVQRTVQQPYF